MISLLIALVVLAIVVLIVRIILAAIGAPAWVLQVVVLIAVIIAIYYIAQALGFKTPNLSQFPEDPWDSLRRVACKISLTA